MVIGCRRPYHVITRIALYWNEQQKMLVSLSCHTIISLNNCWSCTACCRCYQLGYPISAAAPYTALNRGTIQCNVEAACMFTMFMHLLIYLPPPYPSRLARLLRLITLTLIARPSVLAPSPPKYLWALLLHTCTSCLHLSSFGQSLKNRGPWPQPRYNWIHIIL